MEQKGASHKNIWYGLGRQRIEIPKPILKSRVLNNRFLKQLYIASLGYYPRAEGHYTYRKKGLSENFLFYCVDGKGWYRIEDRQYQIGRNEFFILPPHVEHAYGSSPTDPWSIYWIHFGGDLLPELNAVNAIQAHMQPAHVKNSEDIPICFSKMYKALELGYSADNLMFANMCLTNFISLFIYDGKHNIATEKDKIHVVDSAIHYMQERICDKITLDDLSRHFNYSSSRFSCLFRHRTGYAPIDYFIQMKMQKASQQLDFTDKSVKEIALNMGFDDPYYFSRRFSKVIGVSPTTYREMNKD
jgi:AraC family transcriptional regulator, arabinose operon regulatory protein